MIANKNKTIIAPTYTITKIIDKNSTFKQNKHPADNKNTQTKPNKTSIIFFEATQIKEKYKTRKQKKKKLHIKKLLLLKKNIKKLK